MNVYYALTNFYQNHRRYVKSRDDNQLLGYINTEPSSDCDPFVKEAKDKKQVYIPCGAIANSMFSGELALLSFFDFKQPPSLNPYRSFCK